MSKDIEMWDTVGLSDVEITAILSNSKPPLTKSSAKLKAVVPGIVIVFAMLVCFTMPFFFHALAAIVGKEFDGDYHHYAIVASSLVCILSIFFVAYTTRFEVTNEN